MFFFFPPPLRSVLFQGYLYWTRQKLLFGAANFWIITLYGNLIWLLKGLREFNVYAWLTVNILCWPLLLLLNSLWCVHSRVISGHVSCATPQGCGPCLCGSHRNSPQDLRQWYGLWILLTWQWTSRLWLWGEAVHFARILRHQRNPFGLDIWTQISRHFQGLLWKECS